MKRSNFTMIPNELIDSKIEPRALALYVYLARLKSPRASYQSILSALRIGSKSTVKKLIDILESEGWISYSKGSPESGSNLYKLNWSKSSTRQSTVDVLPPVHEVYASNTHNTNIDDRGTEALKKWNLQILNQ